MPERFKTISLRQFRERAAEIHESIDIAIRDRDGNLQIIGFYTPYMAEPATYPVHLEGTGQIEHVVLPPVELTIPGPKVIRTPEEAAAAAPQVRPFPKAEQAGRKAKR